MVGFVSATNGIVIHTMRDVFNLWFRKSDFFFLSIPHLRCNDNPIMCLFTDNVFTF